MFTYYVLTFWSPPSSSNLDLPRFYFSAPEKYSHNLLVLVLESLKIVKNTPSLLCTISFLAKKFLIQCFEYLKLTQIPQGRKKQKDLKSAVKTPGTTLICIYDSPDKIHAVG